MIKGMEDFYMGLERAFRYSFIEDELIKVYEPVYGDKTTSIVNRQRHEDLYHELGYEPDIDGYYNEKAQMDVEAYMCDKYWK